MVEQSMECMHFAFFGVKKLYGVKSLGEVLSSPVISFTLKEDR